MINELNSICLKIAKWNKDRYSQVYSHALAVELLNEEYSEWRTAKNRVESIDALCDIFYVSVGALWKLKIGEDALAVLIGKMLSELHTNKVQYNTTINLALRHFSRAESGYAVIISTILVETFKLMQHLLGDKDAIQALLIVCHSNDTKNIARVSNHIKANIDKGENYVSPKEALTKLLSGVKNA